MNKCVFFVCVVVVSATHHCAHWDYDPSPNTQTGPDNWGEICDDYAACGAGQLQSPISINDTYVMIDDDGLYPPHHFEWSTPPTMVQYLNNGHTVQVNWPIGYGWTQGVFPFFAEDYRLLQFHCHCPSEHHLQGFPQDMEFHFVHYSDSDMRYVVLGLFIQEETGAPEPPEWLKSLLQIVPPTPEHDEPTIIAIPAPPIETLTDIIFSSYLNLVNYTHYNGSFTTPPCTEAVSWIVADDIITVPPNTLSPICTVIQPNARPVMPVNERPLFHSGYMTDFNWSSHQTFSFETCEHWVYDESSQEGPEHWGEICDEYAECGTGTNQSPINLIPSEFAVDDSIGVHGIYWNQPTPDDPVFFLNNGHTLQVNWPLETDSFIETMLPYESEANLLQFHFHCPSEHTVSDIHADMEAHFVHYSAVDNHYTVLGIFFNEVNESTPSPFLSALSPIPDIDTQVSITPPNLNDLLSVISSKPVGLDDYVFYDGSFTTPPCTEAVSWILANNIIEASNLDLICDVLSDNNRPTLSVNSRTVSSYSPVSYSFSPSSHTPVSRSTSRSIGDTSSSTHLFVTPLVLAIILLSFFQ